jgi:hypothetical protein
MNIKSSISDDVTSSVASSYTNTYANLPLYISNLIFWGKPQDIAVTTQLETFPDSSGNSNNASQSTAGFRPNIVANGIGTKNTLDFDGTDDRYACHNLGLALAGNDKAWSIHFPFKADTVATTRIMFQLRSSVNIEDYMWVGFVGAGAWRVAKQTLNANRVNVDFGTADTNEHVISVVHKGTTTDVWFDGIKVADGVAQDVPTATYNQCLIGAFVQSVVSNFFDGKMGEILVYSKANSDGEVRILHNYLSKTFTPSLPIEVDLIMGTGQSNMMGAGMTGEASPSVTKGTAYRYNSSALTVISGDPVGGASNFSCVPAFVNQWRAVTGRSTVYIARPVSGSALLVAADIGSGNWKKGSGTLYNTALTDMNAAIAFLRDKTTFYVNSKRILWAQGEREAQSINGTTITSSLYQAGLEELVDNFNSDVSGGINHFHIFELGAHNLGTGESDWASIRTAQNAVASSRSKASVIFTNAKNFPSQSKMEDDLHYNKTGLNEMGSVGATVASTR